MLFDALLTLALAHTLAYMHVRKLGRMPKCAPRTRLSSRAGIHDVHAHTLHVLTAASESDVGRAQALGSFIGHYRFGQMHGHLTEAGCH